MTFTIEEFNEKQEKISQLPIPIYHRDMLLTELALEWRLQQLEKRVDGLLRNDMDRYVVGGKDGD